MSLLEKLLDSDNLTDDGRAYLLELSDKEKIDENTLKELYGKVNNGEELGPEDIKYIASPF